MTNFEDLVMRNELVQFMTDNLFTSGGWIKSITDIESFAEWLQKDANDILILRSDVIRVLKSHLDEKTIDNDQFQKLLSDIDYLEPHEEEEIEGIGE